MGQAAADHLTYGLLGLPRGPLAAALNFFIYDTVKIFLLLAIIIFMVSYLRTHITPEKTRRLLGGKRVVPGAFLAAGLGMFTPFCSCSAIPLFIGFIEAGVPLGVTFTFLVASPMINEIAVGLLLATFGLKVMLLYVGTGMIIAMVSGLIIQRLKLESQVEQFVFTVKVGCAAEGARPTQRQRMRYAASYVREIIGKVGGYILIAVGLGSFMHGYAPPGMLADWAGPGNPLAVPLAVLIGVPLYANAAGIIPVISELTRLGVQTGTALAFMMAVTALSLPEFIILKKVLKLPLLTAYFGIVALGIMTVGYLFNAVIG